jgi:hypothetical protein
MAPRRTKPGRTTARLCRRADQMPSAISLMRPSASRLYQFARSGSSARARATWASAGTRSSLHGVQLWDPQTKRRQHVGCYASEEDATRAYGCAAVQASGPGAKRNFPPASIDANPVAVSAASVAPASSAAALGGEKRKADAPAPAADGAVGGAPPRKRGALRAEAAAKASKEVARLPRWSSTRYQTADQTALQSP